MNISKGRSYSFVFIICGICFFEYVGATDFVDENTNTTLPVAMEFNILENNATTIVQNDNGTTVKRKLPILLNSTLTESETLFEKLIIQPNGLPIHSALSVIPLDGKKKTISENEIHSAAFPSTNSSQKSESTTTERRTLADFSPADVYKQFGLNNPEISKNAALSIASAGEYVQEIMQAEENSKPETLNNIIRDENINASSPIFTDTEKDAPSTDRYEEMTIGISLTNEENFIAPVKITSAVSAPEEVISLKSSNLNSSHVKDSTVLGYGRSMSLSDLANIDRSAEGISGGQSNQSTEFNSLNTRNGYLGSAAAENKLEQHLHALRYPEMLTDLSDVSFNIEENEPKSNNMHYNGRNPEEYKNDENATAFNLLKIAEKPIFTTTSENKECIENQEKYKNGETLDRNCIERCTCNRGEWICEPRCSGNYVRHGSTFEKQGCHLIPSDDECCAFIECIQIIGGNSTFLKDTNTLTTSIVEVPSECNFNGAIYKFRERLEIGCDKICHCDYGGRMNCHPRCAGRNHTKLEKCVLVKDPKDICCQLELCDVTLDDHEETPSPLTHLPSKENSISMVEDAKPERNSCFYNDANYNISQQFNNGCDSLCICTQEGIHCARLDCPSTFGLDVLDPHCLRWEPVPASFQPIVPKCCPERMRCVDNGTCVYKGLKFDNWSPIPTNLTGCDQHCYCENGKVECQPSCPPVLALPPSDLPCHQSLAKLIPTPDDNCCKHWGCNSLNTTISTEYSNSKELSHGNLRSELEVITLEAIDAKSARVIFKVPQTYVNLHGRVELRYTNNNNNDTSSWEAQIFAPPEDLIATSQLEFELPNLEPNSLYKVKIKLILRDLNVQPSSMIYTVKIPAERTITPPSLVSDYRPDFNDVLISIEDPKLTIKQTNATWLEISWRKFTDDELEFVDGLELRYKKLSEKNYTNSPPIHRKLTSHLIENLQPNTGYEIGLCFIPFSGHGTDLIAGDTIRVRTASMSNAFAFVVNITVSKIKSTSVEVSWNGVPYPEDKFVNIYRAVYQSDSGKENSSVFKNTKQDLNTTTIISNLKPGTKYRIWLEMYLVNGNIKKSNMLSFITKPGSTHFQVDSGKVSTAGVSSTHVGDYYGPLVVVSVIAVLALMSTLVLLLMLTRKRVHQTASITPPSKDNAAYDNPSYKVEIQHETMNL